MKRMSNGQIVGVMIGGLMVVCAFAAIAITGGAAAETENPPTRPVGSGGSSGRAAWTPTPDIAGLAVRVFDAPPNAWVQIQWSNWFEQNWYPVDAWSGKLSQSVNGWAAVWYTAKDYYSGPFRYVIFDDDPAKGGQVWGMSLPFYLGHVGDFRIVEVHKGENLDPGQQSAVSTPDPRMWFYAPKGVQYKSNPAGCGGYTISGDVVSSSGRPLSELRVRLTYPNGVTETIKAGGAPDYGPSGFGYLLWKVQIGQTYKLELLPLNSNVPLASPVQIVFSGDCRSNDAWVVFQSER